MKLIASMLSWAAPGVGGVVNPWVLLVIAAAAAVVFGAGSVAGWTANGWKLGAELATVRSDLRAATTQGQICGDKLATQNQAVDVLGQLGGQIQQGTVQLQAAIRAQTAGQLARLGQLEGKLQAPVPTRPDGRPADCGDAWREIQQAGGKP